MSGMKFTDTDDGKLLVRYRLGINPFVLGLSLLVLVTSPLFIVFVLLDANTPFLGVEHRSPDTHELKGCPEGRFVSRVFDNSSAAGADIRSGDILVGHDEDSLGEAIRSHQPGETMRIDVCKAGIHNTLDIELREKGLRGLDWFLLVFLAGLVLLSLHGIWYSAPGRVELIFDWLGKRTLTISRTNLGIRRSSVYPLEQVMAFGNRGGEGLGFARGVGIVSLSGLGQMKPEEVDSFLKELKSRAPDLVDGGGTN